MRCFWAMLFLYSIAVQIYVITVAVILESGLIFPRGKLVCIAAIRADCIYRVALTVRLFAYLYARLKQIILQAVKINIAGKIQHQEVIFSFAKAAAPANDLLDQSRTSEERRVG